MNRRKHLQLLQLEKQRLEFIKGFVNTYQMEAFRFMLEYKEKSKKKLIVGIIAICGALIFGYWNLITDFIRMVV